MIEVHMKKLKKDKIFMSYNKHVIWYTTLESGERVYMVAKGDGTDSYFYSWEDAMNWIDEHYR